MNNYPLRRAPLASVKNRQAARGHGKRSNIRRGESVCNCSMKTLFTLALTAISMAALATSTLAGGSGCGACPASGEKAKDKTEEGVQS